eukprot:CAMPEP_0181200094 /NCGR_PEP_ID=MMETSP1096-20121128/17560_1 /TAXON_ID=156174 ORGANISM="Chrysochromulina ericina, Strain CCMP281" /NCGR_SAMPLE_ID=MMETSP1096 /ASSEMBLY_ACC=CAM_ASM_000453 /LENGTH=175 /DNA_ID=CAMNT_0023290387 /DNA_START=1 /DNA_END=528 /DNA_ORIENTATION=-
MDMVFGDKPTPFIVCTVMWFLHGLILDIIIIGVLPVISGEKTASAMFYNSKLANLAPQHRRFIAENTAYAVMRIAPIFFTDNLPVLLITVASYFVEGFTICREIYKYKSPSDAMGPATLMGVFASVVTYAATVNTDGYIKEVDPTVLMVLQGFCGLTWACWVASVVGTATAKKTA